VLPHRLFFEDYRRLDGRTVRRVHRLHHDRLAARSGGLAAGREIPHVFKEPPSTYAAGPPLRQLLRGLEVKESIHVDSITFEYDYPNQDSTWPNTHSYAEPIMAGLDDHKIYKIYKITR
jgi:hypothetical protein